MGLFVQQAVDGVKIGGLDSLDTHTCRRGRSLFQLLLKRCKAAHYQLRFFMPGSQRRDSACEVHSPLPFSQDFAIYDRRRTPKACSLAEALINKGLENWLSIQIA